MSQGLVPGIRPARAPDRDTVVPLLEAEDLEARFVPEEFLVVDDGGEVVGCARLVPVEEDLLELASVAVVPDRRGEGIGRTLVQRALARADRPVHALCLEPGFFESMGFERLDRVPGPLREKAGSCCAERDVVAMTWRPR